MMPPTFNPAAQPFDGHHNPPTVVLREIASQFPVGSLSLSQGGLPIEINIGQPSLELCIGKTETTARKHRNSCFLEKPFAQVA